METREKWKKLLFFLFFHSFCFFSSLFRGRIEENGARRNPFLFLLPFLFLKRNGDKNGNEKAFFFPLFLLFFLLFPPSSFQFFLLFREGKWRGKRIKEIAFWRIKEKCKNKQGSKKPYISRVFGTHSGFLIPFWYHWYYSHHKFNIRDSLSCWNA